MIVCYLGLGSNLRSPERQLRQALAALQKLPHCALTKTSSVYFSKPYGMRAQPTYCNMVVQLLTTLPPTLLLAYCHKLEKNQLRVRNKRWGSRTLDIDILLYGKQRIHSKLLTIPHPQMFKRDFVLLPILEITSDLHYPGGKRLDSYLSQCVDHVIPI